MTGRDEATKTLKLVNNKPDAEFYPSWRKKAAEGDADAAAKIARYDRRPPEELLEVVLLGGRQLVVQHDGVGVDGEAELLQLLGLPLAEVPGRVGPVATLHETGDLVGTCGVDEEGEA